MTTHSTNFIKAKKLIVQHIIEDVEDKDVYHISLSLITLEDIECSELEIVFNEKQVEEFDKNLKRELIYVQGMFQKSIQLGTIDQCIKNQNIKKKINKDDIPISDHSRIFFTIRFYEEITHKVVAQKKNFKADLLTETMHANKESLIHFEKAEINAPYKIIIDSKTAPKVQVGEKWRYLYDDINPSTVEHMTSLKATHVPLIFREMIILYFFKVRDDEIEPDDEYFIAVMETAFGLNIPDPDECDITSDSDTLDPEKFREIRYSDFIEWVEKVVDALGGKMIDQYNEIRVNEDRTEKA